MPAFTGQLGSAQSLLGRIQLAAMPGDDVITGRAWTYNAAADATYGGTAVFSYGNTLDWTYTPVTG